MAELILISLLLLLVVDFARTKHIKEEKLTHLRLYWHKSIKGQNPSSIIINQPISNSSLFGMITIMDDPLTLDMVKKNSTVVVGHAQGIYAETAQEEISFLMVMNFVFTSEKYNGSTITIIGQNKASSKIREMPVVGGSGIFRFARGYVEARTMFFDMESGVATVEYNCHVLHY